MEEGDVAVIAGVGSGIGARFVENFAQVRISRCRLGAKVGFSRADSRAARRYRRALRFLDFDITDEDQVKKIFTRVRQELGLVSLLVCNWGGGVKRAPFLEVSAQGFLRNLHGQAFGPFLSAQQAIPDMLWRGGGTVD